MYGGQGANPYNVVVTLAFSGVPKERGTTPELAASQLPSQGPKRGRKCYVTLQSRGSPTKGTKSEVKTYARGNNDAPSISKYGSLVRAYTQIVALRLVRPLSAAPKRSAVGHGSKKMPGACLARSRSPLDPPGGRGWGRGSGFEPEHPSCLSTWKCVTQKSLKLFVYKQKIVRIEPTKKRKAV